MLGRLRLGSKVPELAAQVLAARRRADRRAGEAVTIAKHGLEAQERAAHWQAQAELCAQAAGVLTKLGEQRQADAQRLVEELVTRGLQVIFGEELSFHIQEAVKGNQPTVNFVIRSVYQKTVPGHGSQSQCVDTPVLEARGGGMAVVVAFILRLVILLLTPGVRRVLLLDESFSHVSAEYEPRLAEFLRETADKAGVQLILVTHSTAYDDLADKRYRFTLGPGGETQVQEL